jgi:hypothetical protein
MKQYQKKQSSDLIKFNNQVQTSWITLFWLLLGTFFLGLYLATVAVDNFILINNVEAAQIHPETSQNQVVGREIQIITTSEYNAEKARKQVILDLMQCESSGKTHAVGDNGDSIGYFQWQKPTFDEKIGYETTYQFYYDYVTDYDKISKLTYEVFFDQGEWWRWENCSYKIGYKN